ncbi:Conjugal transfer protein [Mycoavidus cysteinexigens]|uniref:Conjugal transfer protein n=1 Tax=Mycoavidus cysteinexigens TaxID=1553431 RepID=A0A2Z6EXR4_9BURK|nr:P-type DNA transfer protein VirB5 [Mycoavidus cysteinexigens]BBE10244.1 Conjugal transfer protein [Mycoavidus cysteinexigens]GAM53389.1 minor pilin of type IV secretion complex, VirB5 [bacterium endosymbiont of Mortierella elongata FMR23-6]GLR00661.1 P-type DNA transfer protein VirB5 [Mycoavidus cysteinexigens]
MSKKLTLIYATALAIQMIQPTFARANGMPVIDVVAAAHAIEQISRMAEQIKATHDQLQQARQQYEAITGQRGLGSLFYRADLGRTLPPNWRTVYDAAQNGNYGISGSIQEILKQEQTHSSIQTAQRDLELRRRQIAATDKAIGLKAYEGAQQRLDQIEALMKKISATEDPKALDELQARINIEQAAIQNETVKLAMISQLQKAEQQLIAEQKRALSQRILNSQNQAMPTLRE